MAFLLFKAAYIYEDKDDVPLMQMLGLSTTRLWLQKPIDVSEYIDIDSCAPATEDLLDDRKKVSPTPVMTKMMANKIILLRIQHFSDAPEGRDFILGFCCEKGLCNTAVAKLMTAQHSLRVAAVEAACKLRKVHLMTF